MTTNISDVQIDQALEAYDFSCYKNVPEEARAGYRARVRSIVNEMKQCIQQIMNSSLPPISKQMHIQTILQSASLSVSALVHHCTEWTLASAQRGANLETVARKIQQATLDAPLFHPATQDIADTLREGNSLIGGAAKVIDVVATIANWILPLPNLPDAPQWVQNLKEELGNHLTNRGLDVEARYGIPAEETLQANSDIFTVAGAVAAGGAASLAVKSAFRSASLLQKVKIGIASDLQTAELSESVLHIMKGGDKAAKPVKTTLSLSETKMPLSIDAVAVPGLRKLEGEAWMKDKTAIIEVNIIEAQTNNFSSIMNRFQEIARNNGATELELRWWGVVNPDLIRTLPRMVAKRYQGESSLEQLLMPLNILTHQIPLK